MYYLKVNYITGIVLLDIIVLIVLIIVLQYSKVDFTDLPNISHMLFCSDFNYIQDNKTFNSANKLTSLYSLILQQYWRERHGKPNTVARYLQKQYQSHKHSRNQQCVRIRPQVFTCSTIIEKIKLFVLFPNENVQ